MLEDVGFLRELQGHSAEGICDPGTSEEEEDETAKIADDHYKKKNWREGKCINCNRVTGQSPDGAKRHPRRKVVD